MKTWRCTTLQVAFCILVITQCPFVAFGSGAYYSDVPHYNQAWFTGSGDCMPNSATQVLGWLDAHSWPRMVPGGESNTDNSFATNPTGVTTTVNAVKDALDWWTYNSFFSNLYAWWDGVGNNIKDAAETLDTGASGWWTDDDNWTSWTDMTNQIDTYGPMIFMTIDSLTYYYGTLTNGNVSNSGSTSLHSMCMYGYSENVYKVNATARWIIVDTGWSNTSPAWINYDAPTTGDVYTVEIRATGTPTAPPPSPTSITYPTSDSDGSYTVSWSSSSGATSYQLERSSNGGDTWSQIYSGSSRSRAENVGGGSYRYRVRAFDGSVYSLWRTGTHDCVVSIPPPRPTVETRSATLVGKTAAMLNGRIVDDGGSSIIERRFDWGRTPSGDGWTDWTRGVSVSGDYFSYYLTGLNPGTTYYFRAWAANRDPADPSGWGQGSILSFTTTSPTVQYSITALAGANGSISPSGTIVKNAGESQQFTAMPNTGYTVDTWYLDGSSVQTGGTNYTLPNIQSDHTVYVTFGYVPPKYTITASAGANGSISPSGTIVKNAGENQQFIATPNTGYTVDTWHMDGSADQTGGTTYTLNNIQSDYSIHVTFKSVPPEYTITASAGANGSISPSGTIEKNAGESQQFTATPNANYAVDQWYLNGSSVQTGGSSYTLTDIQSDHTIYVTFKTIPPTTIYVDDDASHDPGPGDPSVSDPLENGSTEHPYDSIQEAIDVASNGDTIIVLDGTYRGSSNRNIDFSGKAITVRSQNGSENCIIDCQGTVSEPHRGFKFHSGEGSSSVIDGLTITNGYGPFEDYGSVASSLGGGICCLESSPTIANCIITNNTVSSYNCYGAGIFGRNSSLIVTNCVILNNSTNGTYCYGGGIYLHGGSARIINSAIMGNAALGVRGGGGIYSAHYDSTTIIGCLVTGNSAGTGGGIHFQSRSNGIISNCTIANNSAGVGNGITYGYIWGLTTTNSILWDGGNEIYPQGVQFATPVATFCNVQGGTPGEGNIDMDPLFVDASNPDPDKCDYHLMANSPCINAGDPGYSPDPGETDFDGNPRIVDNRIDIGAYEFQGLIIGDFCGANFGPPDGYVDVWDLMAFADHWHTRIGDSNWDPQYDLAGPNFADPDGYIDVWDLMAFADHWHEGVNP